MHLLGNEDQISLHPERQVETPLKQHICANNSLDLAKNNLKHLNNEAQNSHGQELSLCRWEIGCTLGKEAALSTVCEFNSVS